MKLKAAQLFKDLVPTEKPAMAVKANAGIHPGQVIRTPEGPFRVEAKVFTSKGASLRLASLDGKTILSKEAAQIQVMSSWENRIASFVRLASSDWNEYVNHFLAEAGVQPDPDMDWNAWFNTMSGKYLKVPSDDPHAETAIHDLLIKLFMEDNLLGKYDPERGGEKTPENISRFLKAQIGLRMDRMREAYDEDRPETQADQGNLVSGDTPVGQDDTSKTLYDTKGDTSGEFANPEDLANAVESNANFATFRDTFLDWVKGSGEVQERTVEPVSVLFDLVLATDVSSHEGHRIRSQVAQQFKALTGKEPDTIKGYCKTLSQLLVRFARKAPSGIVNLPIVEHLRALAPQTKEAAIDKESEMSLKNKLAAIKAKYAKAPVVNKWAKMQRIAEEEPEEMGQATGELAMAFATLAEAADALAQNLGHTEEAVNDDFEAKSPEEAKAARLKRYAKFRQLAFDNPGSLADALQEMYDTMDTVAEGVENLAQNLGIELTPGGMGGDMGMGMDPMGGDMGMDPMGGDLGMDTPELGGMDTMDGEVAPSSPEGGIPVETEPAPVEEGGLDDMAPKAASKKLMTAALGMSREDQVRMARALLALNQ